jgi:plasmid stabilization system protein ParE
MTRPIISKRAQREIERIDRRWIETRSAATDLFFSELREILDLLENNPGLGVLYPPKPGVRRILLRGSLYHVYYEVAGKRVAVLSVWSAVRGRGPKL